LTFALARRCIRRLRVGRIEEAIVVCALAQVHPSLRSGRGEITIDVCALAQVHPPLARRAQIGSYCRLRFRAGAYIRRAKWEKHIFLQKF